MKKISKIIMLTLLLATTVLTGCSTVNTDTSQYKIYELAIENGYDKNYETWNQEFNAETIEFKSIDKDLCWKYVVDSEWNDLYKFSGEEQTWYKELVSGDLGFTLTKYYSISFNTNTTSTINPQILLSGEKGVIPAEITKEGYVFDDWYNGDVSFDFDTAITQTTVLDAKWLIDGIHLDGFKSEDNYYTLEVNNDVEELSVEEYISTDSEWLLSTSSDVSGEIESKTATLLEGTNVFYLISIGTENKVYEIRIKRLEMFDVVFKFVYTNKNLETTEAPISIQENSLVTKNDYSQSGYIYSVDFDYKTKITEDTLITITYSPKEYTIDFNLAGGNALQESFVKVDFEATVTLPTPTKDRHEFLGWVLDDSLISNEYTYDQAKDIKLTALWQQNEFFINYELDGAIQVEGNPTGYDRDNAQLELLDVSKTGYNFIGWYTDKELSNEISFIPANSTEEFNLYAKFEAKTYTITFVTEGTAVSDLTVTYDQEFILPSSSKDDFVFTGWYLEERLYSGIWKIDNDITLTAKFETFDFKIEYVIPENVSNEYNVNGYNYGTTTILQDPSDYTGYTFFGWYNGENLITEISSETTGKLILTAKYEANTYTITFDVDGVTNSLEIKFDSEFNVSSPFKSGFKFLGWNYNEELFTSDIWNIASNVTLVAVFEPYDYLLTFESETENNIDNRTGYDIGETVLLLTPANKEGYTFLGWYIDEELITEITPDMSGDLTLVAKFEANTYIISFSTEGHDIDSLEVVYDDEFTLPDGTRDGFDFILWTLNGETFTSGVWTISENVELIPVWSIITYEITYELNDSENNELNVFTYTWEHEITFEDPSRQFDTFLGWYNGEEEITGIASNSFGDITLTAKFESHEFTIEYVLNEGTVSIENVSSYSYDNGQIELFSPVSPIYFFSYWCLDETLNNRIIYLNFELIKELYTLEMTTITLYAKYTNSKVEKQIFNDSDYYDVQRDYIYFGSYPQTYVSNTTTISKLDEITEVNENGYYEYNNKQYAKIVVETANSVYTYSNGDKVKNGVEAYFEVDYIKWRILKNDDGTLTLLSENILVGNVFNDSEDDKIIGENTIYSNNYEHSTLRYFLNDTFLNSAFNSYHTSSFVPMEFDDLISVLSLEDIKSAEYGFEQTSTDLSRISSPTDYAIATCVSYDYTNNNRGGTWWLSDSSDYGTNLSFNVISGYMSEQLVTNRYVGVRPNIVISI